MNGSRSDETTMRALTTQEKYPFSTPELRDEIRHSFWLLDRDGITDDIHLFNEKLREWEDYYNYHRPHGALGGDLGVVLEVVHDGPQDAAAHELLKAHQRGGAAS